jgi:hypothetical protein
MLFLMSQTLKCFSIICVDTNYLLLDILKVLNIFYEVLTKKIRITWIRVSMVSVRLLVDNGLQVLLGYWLDSN